MSIVAELVTSAVLACVPPDNAISVRFPQSNIHVAFVADGFEKDAKQLAELRKGLSERAMLAGKIGEGVNVSMYANERMASRSLSDLRKTMYGEATPFEVGDIVCCEQVQDLDKVKFTSWRAFLPAGPYYADLHVSTIATPDGLVTAGYDREKFSALVATYSSAVFRRHDWKAYPAGVIDTMNAVLRAGDPAKEIAAREKATPGDAVLAFVKAEVNREMRVALEESTKNFQAAVTALDKAKAANGELLLARIVALDGLGVALQTADKYKESIPHFEKAVKLGAEKHKDTHDYTAYNLACSYAHTKNAAKAVAALKLAIEVDPKNRKIARDDKDFAAIASSKEFQALVAEPAK
jgi:tetratricopeptide (TPR) repeat protein